MQQLPEEEITEGRLKRKTFLSFAAFTVLSLSAGGYWKWLYNRPKEYGAKKPVRDALTANEKIFSETFSPAKLVKEYPKSEVVKQVKVNGRDGLREKVNAENWRLAITKKNGEVLTLTMDDIKKLPKKEIIIDFKCIEGWDQVTHWGGVPVKDFIEAYGLQEEAALQYMGLATPDKKYYVGIDMPSAVHPQTLLCYEMNGAPLAENQGYPLRLIIPVKYGIKHLKRIGTITFSNEKPPDFWAERGYDYYAGH